MPCDRLEKQTAAYGGPVIKRKKNKVLGGSKNLKRGGDKLFRQTHSSLKYIHNPETNKKWLQVLFNDIKSTKKKFFFLSTT